MAIYTPRGLKIRLPLAYSFALMKRLTPQVGVFRFLKHVEALEEFPSFWSSISAIVAFFTFDSLVPVFATVFCIQVLAHLVRIVGLPLPTILVSPVLIYTFISGYGIVLASICIIAYVRQGWEGVAVYVLACVGAGVLNGIVSFWRQTQIHRNIGLAVTTSELVFFNSYLQLARRYGKSLDLDVSEEEMREDNWADTFSEFASEWPEVVARFTVD